MSKAKETDELGKLCCVSGGLESESMSERKPTVLKGGLKTYRVALYEVRDGKAELIDLLELDARNTKNIFRTLHRRLREQGK